MAVRPDTTFHWLLLWLAVGILLAASVLRVQGNDQVVLPIIDLPIPGVCTYQRWLGISCPGCGLTRCFISVAHGDLPGAYRFNAVGIMFFVLAALQIPLRSWQLWRIRRGQPEICLHPFSAWIFWALLGALIGQWVVRTFLF